jgi:3-oxoacyl-[acyl-carrier protein] reductase
MNDTLPATGQHAPRRALVCGASSGIGRACAHALAAAGVSVLALARTGETLAQLVSELPSAPGQEHRAIALDMADLVALEAVIAAELAQNGAIEIFINNTGGPPAGAIASATCAQFLAAFQQHLLAGHVLATQLLPGMRARGFGRIVSIISTSVKEPLKDLGVSNTVRAAVAAWAKTFAGEVASAGITVNNVLPGFTETPRLEAIVANRVRKSGADSAAVAAELKTEVPMQRFAKASEVAAAVAFLASDAASYITGINLPVDGGRTKSL